MKLTQSDKDYLINLGYPKEDIQQIQKASSKNITTYELDNKVVSLEEVLGIMDKTEYLSGIARSAFHWSAVRETKDGRKVYFDSSKLFK